MGNLSERTVYIGIHPWDPDVEDPAYYALLRDDRLSNPTKCQVLVLARNVCGETLERYRPASSQWKGRIFLSPPETGIPQSGMTHFASTLKGMSPPQTLYKVWGAVVQVEHGKIVGGAVGHFFQEIQKCFPGQVQLDLPYCYVVDTSRW